MHRWVPHGLDVLNSIPAPANHSSWEPFVLICSVSEKELYGGRKKGGFKAIHFPLRSIEISYGQDKSGRRSPDPNKNWERDFSSSLNFTKCRDRGDFLIRTIETKSRGELGFFLNFPRQFLA